MASNYVKVWTATSDRENKKKGKIMKGNVKNDDTIFAI